ncbi:MAG: PTS sugar transporter subunit IIA [Candidatus Omnitrophota bacterium]|nr:PTS sugar transporter subunit IIA [Candidatus Omnitrophota bacterium]
MRIMDFLCSKAVMVDLKAINKQEAVKELVGSLIKAKEIKDKDSLVKSLLDREALGSTGIGQGVAIPHAKSDGVKKLISAFGLSKKGVNFDALDGEPVYIFFLLVAPLDSAGPHLKALARISRVLKDKIFCTTLRNAKDEKEILKIIKEEDRRRD